MGAPHTIVVTSLQVRMTSGLEVTRGTLETGMLFPKTSIILFLCGGIVLDFYFYLSADKCFLKLSAINIYNGITGSLSSLNSAGY